MTALQINLTPRDYPYLRYLLPHQIRQWQDQVDRIVVNVETQRSAGAYGRGWDTHIASFHALMAEVAADPKVIVCEIDYSPPVADLLAEMYCGGHAVPAKDVVGAPFYAYLAGLYHADARYVLHLDSDMLCGGSSNSWMREAIALMEGRTDVLFAGPFPGPPTEDGQIPAGALARHGPAAVAFAAEYAAARFTHMSTRSFLVNTDRLASAGPIRPVPAVPSRWSNQSPGMRPLEQVLSMLLERQELYRVDLLGSGTGRWVLHPGFHSGSLIEALPAIIDRVEKGDIPAAQRGDFELNDSMIDWSRPRRIARRRARIARIRRLAYAVARRLGNRSE